MALRWSLFWNLLPVLSELRSFSSAPRKRLQVNGDIPCMNIKSKILLMLTVCKMLAVYHISLDCISPSGSRKSSLYHKITTAVSLNKSLLLTVYHRLNVYLTAFYLTCELHGSRVWVSPYGAAAFYTIGSHCHRPRWVRIPNFFRPSSTPLFISIFWTCFSVSFVHIETVGEAFSRGSR